MKDASVEDLKRSLNSRGRRMTRQRQTILEVLRANPCHPTADQLLRRVQEHLPRISLGTVYRNLQVLVDEGYAIRLPASSGSHRFDGDVSPHHHVICSACGTIADVRVGLDEAGITAAERETGFAIDDHRIRFVGLCPKCSDRA